MPDKPWWKLDEPPALVKLRAAEAAAKAGRRHPVPPAASRAAPAPPARPKMPPPPPVNPTPPVHMRKDEMQAERAKLEDWMVKVAGLEMNRAETAVYDQVKYRADELYALEAMSP
ncbi:MAG: hypothetical protein RQ966_16950 [Acetobacteraceae bacterium]|nr:hypothetical protein [Acetobacteraceae bacterium]